MNIIDKNKFFEITKQFEYVPYTQTEAWHAHFVGHKNDSFAFFVDDEHKPKIACVAHVKKALGLKMLLLEGECLLVKTYKSSLIKSFYETMTSLNYDMIEIVSNYPYNSEFEVGIRRAGFLRPVGSFSMPLSNWINLQEDIKCNSNWTRNFKKSQAFDLDFELVQRPSLDIVKSVVFFYNKFSSEKGLSHLLVVESINKLLQSDSFSVGLVKNKEKEILSFIIIHNTKKHAGLLYAASGDKSKDSGATFFMYTELFKVLKEKGLNTFDMEKLVPSTHSTDGVFLFKDGVKGIRTVYNGEWSWYKKSIYRPLMYFVKKWMFKKREV